jgi:hypothetical protein
MTDTAQPKKRKHQPRIAIPGQAGFRYSHFWELVGLSRHVGYTLPAEFQPRSIHIGRSHIVIEAPADYLARLAQLGDIPVSNRVAASPRLISAEIAE